MEEGRQIVTKAHWNQRWEQVHARPIARNDVYWGANGVFLRLMRRLLPDLDGLRVVELGGAYSHFMLAMAKWCDIDATIVDYSPAGIERTQLLFETNQCPVTTLLADMFAWRPAQSFDLVVHWGVIEHFPDPRMVLDVCSRLVCPGGRIIFTMPNMEAWGAYLWRNWAPQSWRQHIHHSDAALEQACRDCGLHMQRRFYWGPPLLQKSAWERGGALPRLVSLCQRAVNMPNRIVPIFQYGTRRISHHRGFVVVKPE